MSLLDFGFILACDDMLIHCKDSDDNGGVPILCTFGRSDTVEKLIATVKKAIDR